MGDGADTASHSGHRGRGCLNRRKWEDSENFALYTGRMPNLLDSKEKVNADELGGPRVYSTDLLNDPGLTAEATVPITKRALKIKLITKGIVTLNSEHLFSPLAVDLLDQTGDLFLDGRIIPAIEVNSADLLTQAEASNAASGNIVEPARLKDHVERLQEAIQTVMPWDARGIDGRFKDMVVDGLRNPHSQIATLLRARDLTEQDVADLAARIGQLDLRRSEPLWTFIDTLDEPIKEDVRRFARSAYHMVGTGVVKCETGTDLHPLSHYKAVDHLIAGRDSTPEMMSDEAIFLDVFMGSALGAIHSLVVPTQIIDSLDFKDAVALSSVLRNQGFQDLYDRVTREYLRFAALPVDQQSLEDLDVELITDAVSNLERQFDEEVLRQLKSHKSNTQQQIEGEMLRATGDIAKAGTNAAPGLSQVLAIYDGAEGVGKLGKAAAARWRIRDEEGLKREGESRRDSEVAMALEKIAISENKKAAFLEAANLLARIHHIRSRPL